MDDEPTPNTVPLIPPEIQELLSGRTQSSPESKPDDKPTDDANQEPKLYKSHEEILADDELVGKLIEDKRVADRIQKAVEEATAKQREDDRIRREQEDLVRKAKEDEEGLENLRVFNPRAYAEEMGRRRVADKAIKEQVEFATALTNDVQGKLTDYVRANFPKEAIDSLAGKQYPGSYGDAIAAYFDDLTKATKDHWKQQWEKDELPAMKKRVLTEINGGEPTVESSTGARVSSKDFASEWEMASAFQEGKITHEEMRAWYRIHGARRR